MILAYQRTVPWAMGPELETWTYNQAISQLPGFIPVGSGPRSWMFQREWTSGWVILLAILFFPIGLLFLLIKSKEHVSVTLYEYAGQSAIAFQGQAPKNTVRCLQANIDSVVYAHSQPNPPLIQRHQPATTGALPPAAG